MVTKRTAKSGPKTGRHGIWAISFPSLGGCLMFAAHVALTATAQADKAHAIRDAQTRKALADARALLAKRRPWWRRILR